MTLTIRSSALIAPTITGVGACIVEALALTPAGAPNRLCYLVPGNQVTHDNCDCGGQFAQVVRNVWGSNTFPTPLAGSWLKCSPHWTVYEVVASVIRCTPGMQETLQGEMPPPPTCADLLAASVQQDYDRAAVRGALQCCLAELAQPAADRFPINWGLGLTLVLPDLGQCSGSETTYLIGVPGSGACC